MTLRWCVIKTQRFKKCRDLKKKKEMKWNKRSGNAVTLNQPEGWGTETHSVDRRLLRVIPCGGWRVGGCPLPCMVQPGPQSLRGTTSWSKVITLCLGFPLGLKTKTKSIQVNCKQEFVFYVRTLHRGHPVVLFLLSSEMNYPGYLAKGSNLPFHKNQDPVTCDLTIHTKSY